MKNLFGDMRFWFWGAVLSVLGVLRLQRTKLHEYAADRYNDEIWGAGN